MHEVTHFVIDAEEDHTGFDMASKQWRACEKIEDHAPASDFRMMIAA